MVWLTRMVDKNMTVKHASAEFAALFSAAFAENAQE